MYLVIGLGNPGKEYENTRHNLGFVAAEEVAQRLNIPDLKFKHKCNALVGEAKLESHKVVLAEPQTFMNLSGDAVIILKQWYKIPPENIIVIHDDVDLEPGEIKIKRGGGSAGHHGIESIAARLGTPDFIRVRLGVGRGGANDVSEHVLDDIPPSQRTSINGAVAYAADAVISIITDGLDPSMNMFNGLRAS